jgi:HK97 family phage prohead protease
VLLGYAATFGSMAKIGSFTESIRAGAFADTLRSGKDLLALIDHDPKEVLARTKSGNLKLSEDSRGLHFELNVPETTYGADILELVERGDAGGASFAFQVRKNGEKWEGNHRELLSIDLHEISIVRSWPAYPDTLVVARSATPHLNLVNRYLETIR